MSTSNNSYTDQIALAQSHLDDLQQLCTDLTGSENCEIATTIATTTPIPPDDPNSDSPEIQGPTSQVGTTVATTLPETQMPDFYCGLYDESCHVSGKIECDDGSKCDAMSCDYVTECYVGLGESVTFRWAVDGTYWKGRKAPDVKYDTLFSSSLTFGDGTTDCAETDTGSIVKKIEGTWSGGVYERSCTFDIPTNMTITGGIVFSTSGDKANYGYWDYVFRMRCSSC